jgi:Domain of Unknown Function (DUF349)
MSFLDKLKPQPRWKHSDPTIRLEAVRELEDAAELAVLAETDPDPRVRRAAVAGTSDPSVLGRIANADGDNDVRDRAADRLAALAVEPDDAIAVAAVRALGDARRLSTIAKGDAPDAVRDEALSRIVDQRALGSIARNARHERTASAAVARVTDAADLLEVALNADHRDVALQAFDRIVSNGAEVALLRTIESRAQQKAVGRRARVLLQEIEEAEAARRAADDERRRRESGLCEAAEQIATVADIGTARTELARLSESWLALGSTDEAAQARFASAMAGAQAAIVHREREIEEAAELARQRAEAIATRDALCLRVETLEGDDMLEQLVPIEEEWRSLLPLVGDGPEADRLAERFAMAVAACRKRHEMGARLAETRASLEALVVEAEGLSSHDDAAEAAARWQALSREARGLAATLSEALRPADDLLARLAAVADAFAAREAASREAAGKARRDLVVRLQRLGERARRTSEADTITLREGERLMRDIGAALDEAGRAEPGRDVDEATGALRGLQEQVAPRVRELREMDDWRRFANAQRQEQLIAMAEAIVASLKTEAETGKESDLAATAKALRELHAKWQEVAEAPRQSAQKLWDRFRTATDFIRSRCEVYFSKVREERQVALQRKAAIAEEAEALATTSDWAKATARFQQLQVEWQQTGPNARDASRELGQRFRAACNTFFARRREDLASRKKTWAENLARKEALCERAETLAESTEWESASAEMKRLQAEWKTIGPVRRNKSEVIWNRFRSAADRFFERFHNRHQIAVAGKLAEREAMIVDLEALAAAEEAPADLAERVQGLRSTWNRSVPIPAVDMRPFSDRWQAAFSQILERHADAFKGSDLDPAAIVQRMDKLVGRVESLLADVREPAASDLSPTELLAARLRSALASNAMGGRSADDSRWRSASDAVKDAQAAWQRLVPVAGPEARALETRFRDACRRVNEQVRHHVPSGAGPSRRSHKPTAAAV